MESFLSCLIVAIAKQRPRPGRDGWDPDKRRRFERRGGGYRDRSRSRERGYGRDSFRDRGGYRPRSRSPPRRRSRSPPRRGRSPSPMRRRDDYRRDDYDRRDRRDDYDRRDRRY